MVDGVLPMGADNKTVARSLMFYDWEKPIAGDWLDVVENFFSKFDVSIQEGSGHAANKNSHGSYKRVKKRLKSFLSDYNDSFSIRLRGTPLLDPLSSHYPTDVQFCLSVDFTGQKKGMISVIDSLVGSCDVLVASIAEDLFSFTGPTYGGAWDFPIASGPGEYLAFVNVRPRGMKANHNKEYAERIIRFRNNTRHRKLRVADGYFREIYPINFLRSSHLNMPFQDEALSRFMETCGHLSEVDYMKNLFRWDIAPGRLDEIRRSLETSGLILSSACEPMLIH